MKSECGNFFKDSKMSGEAEDKRFSSIFSADVTEKPNEYDIQVGSGVFDTLNKLPLFKKYVPFAETEKQALIYDIQGRPTLHFDPYCELSIKDAIDDL